MSTIPNPNQTPATKQDMADVDWNSKLHAWLSSGAGVVLLTTLIALLQAYLPPKTATPPPVNVQQVERTDPAMQKILDRLDALEKQKK